MPDATPMTVAACNAARSSCKELRTLENQNLVLNLRAEITGMLDATRRQIDAKFDQLLRDLGYVGDTPADTAVQADRAHHPPRREEDQRLHAKLGAWIAKNAVWLLVTLLALVAGDTLQPFATRVVEALTKAIEGLLK